MPAREWRELTRTERLEMLALGACGAMAPIWVGMARQAVERAVGGSAVEGGLMITHGAAWLACLLLALLGAVVTRAYKEVRPERALALGATAPALILGFANGTSQGNGDEDDQSRPVAQLLAPFVGVKPAYALQDSLSRTQRADSLLVILRQDPRIRQRARTNIVFQDSTRAAPVTLTRQLQANDSLFFVGGDASQLFLQYGDRQTRRISFDSLASFGDTIVLEVDLEEQSKFWTRFKRTLGFRGGTAPSISITAVKPPSP